MNSETNEGVRSNKRPARPVPPRLPSSFFTDLSRPPLPPRTPSVSVARPTASPSNSTQKTTGNYAHSQSSSRSLVHISDSESHTGPNITKNLVERFEGLSTSSPRQPHALSTSRKSADKQPWLFDPKAHDKPTPPHLLQYPATPKLLVTPSEDSEAERPPLPQRHEESSKRTYHSRVDPHRPPDDSSA